MEKQIGLSTAELENIFAQIKAGKSDLSNNIYKAYLPMKNKYAAQYELSEEQITDIFNEAFCYVYEKTTKGVINAGEFGMFFVKIMTKQCMAKAENVEVNSDLMAISYARNMPSRDIQEEKKNEFVHQSLMYVIEVINELSKDEEFAKENGLDAQKIALIKDHYGINRAHRQYSLKEIAEKYNMTESRAQAVLVKGLKCLRDMKEFETIKARLR